MLTACWFLDQAAPMTKTVADCALLLGVIAGHDELDTTTSRRRVPDYAASLAGGVQGIRIGVIRQLHENPNMHPDVKACVDRALQRFTELGAHVREVSIPLMDIAGALYIAIGDTEGAGTADDLLRERSGELDAASRTRLLAAALVPFKLYNRAMKARVQLRRQFMDALQNVDVLACATSPYPPPRHVELTAPFKDGDDVRSRFFFRRAYTGSYALAALPAISVPCGFTPQRLPVGLQLGGKPFAEDMLLRVAAAYERAEPWHLQQAPATAVA
jgi:aspartyl-tRNA(Asn)/glutamyl-tRNA(Gln) amidotransferase subunit A